MITLLGLMSIMGMGEQVSNVIEQRIRKGSPQPALTLPAGTLDKDGYRQTVGERVREVRLKMGLTLDTVAEVTGIPRSNLSRLENLGNVGIDAHTVYVLERLYGIVLDSGEGEGGGEKNGENDHQS